MRIDQKLEASRLHLMTTLYIAPFDVLNYTVQWRVFFFFLFLLYKKDSVILVKNAFALARQEVYYSKGTKHFLMEQGGQPYCIY